MSEESISMVVCVPERSDEKGIFGDGTAATVGLSLAKIKEQFEIETKKFLSILDVPHPKDGWKIDKVEVGVEVSTEGGISFIGTAKIESHATFKVIFSR